MPRPRPSTVLAVFATLLALPATSQAAGAGIGAVDCDRGGAVLTLDGASATPTSWTILRDERAIANVVVQPGAPVTRVVPIAEGAAAQITARSGATYVSALVRRGCSEANATATPATTATASTAIAEASPFESSPTVPATGVRGAAAAAQEAPADAQDTGAMTIPQVARTWPFLVIAAAALLLALALSWGRVRRRLPGRASRQAPAARPPA